MNEKNHWYKLYGTLDENQFDWNNLWLVGKCENRQHHFEFSLGMR